MSDGGRIADAKKVRNLDRPRVDLARNTEGPENESGRDLEPRLNGPSVDPRMVARFSTGQQIRMIQQMQRGYGNAHVARVMARLQPTPDQRSREERDADAGSPLEATLPAALTSSTIASAQRVTAGRVPTASSVFAPSFVAQSATLDDDREVTSDDSAETPQIHRQLNAPHLPSGPSAGSPIIQRSMSGAILDKAAEWAHDVPGYSLLTVVLGKDPINDQPVPRTAINFVHGVISLIPGGDAIFKNLQESGAIDQAFQWLDAESAKLGITWAAVKGAVKQVFDSVSWTDVFEPSAAWDKVKHIIMPLVDRVKQFAVDSGKKLFEFVFEGALKLAGPLAGTIMAAIKKAGDALNTIAKDPGAFLGNLLRAVKGGFEQFMANIETHLKQGLMSWLFGSLAGAGIELPKTFDLKGILSLVLQILGLSWQNLRSKLVRALGEPVVSTVEKTVGFVKTIATEGIAAAWQQIVQWLTQAIGSLKDMVLGAIKDWVVTTIIKQAVMKLVSMFNPIGAIIQAIITIYNTIQFVVDKAKQIADLANAVLDSIANIASGNITAAANYVEQTLGKAVPVVTGFLADLIGLGGITDKIKEIIQKIRQPIDKVMDKMVGFVASKAKPFIDAIKRKGHSLVGSIKGKVAGLLGWASVSFEAAGEHHRVFAKEIGGRTRVMVASDEKPLAAFIDENQQKVSSQNGESKQAGPLAEAAKKEGDTLEGVLENSVAKRSGDPNGALPQGTEQSTLGTLNTIATSLKGLLGLRVQASGVSRNFTPGDIQYNSDLKGRARKAQGWLAPAGGARKGGEQEKVSGPVNRAIEGLREDGIQIDTEFDAGHLIGDQYGGSGETQNLVPMERRLNQNWIQVFEAKVAEHVRKGEPVHAVVEARYFDSAPLAKLIDPEVEKTLTPEQKARVVPVFERIPESVSYEIGVRQSDNTDKVLYQEVFAARERLPSKIATAMAGLIGKRPKRARDVYTTLDEGAKLRQQMANGPDANKESDQ